MLIISYIYLLRFGMKDFHGTKNTNRKTGESFNTLIVCLVHSFYLYKKKSFQYVPPYMVQTVYLLHQITWRLKNISKACKYHEYVD